MSFFTRHIILNMGLVARWRHSGMLRMDVPLPGTSLRTLPGLMPSVEKQVLTEHVTALLLSGVGEATLPAAYWEPKPIGADKVYGGFIDDLLPSGVVDLADNILGAVGVFFAYKDDGTL